MKKIFAVISTVIMLFVSNSTFASPPSEQPTPLDENEFLEYVQNSEFYEEYEARLLSETPLLLNPLKDADENEYGWITQYEVRHGENESEEGQAEVNFYSLLTFAYNNDTQEFNVFLLDYSRLLETKSIFLVDLSGNTPEERIDVSQEEQFIGLFAEVEEKKEEAQNELDEQNLLEAQNQEQQLLGLNSGDIGTQAVDTRCWMCTKTQTYGGDWSTKCQTVVGTACYLGSSHWAVRLTCAGAFIIGCYVPKYTVCVQGKWVSACQITG